MAFEKRAPLTKYQRVKVAQERGTQADAFVLGVLDSGEILIEIEASCKIIVVDREDIQP